MKKSISLICFVILLSGTVMAQKQLYFGVAGTGLSSFITNQNNYGQGFEMDYAVAFGFGGNAIVGFDFNKNIGLKLEIGYAGLGQKYKDTYKDTVYTRDITLNYLQIPLMFKYRTNGEVARFFVAAGPQINYLMSAKQKYYKQGEIDTDSIYNPINNKPIMIGEETITERYSSIDVMGRLDLGVDISITKNLFLNVGLTMAYGFLDINATDWRINDSSGNYNPSHNGYVGVNFGISYVLPVGGK
jgi:hypothetical protein